MFNKENVFRLYAAEPEEADNSGGSSAEDDGFYEPTAEEIWDTLIGFNP